MKARSMTSSGNVMLCYVSEPKKVSKQCGHAKVGLNSIILLDVDNILSIILNNIVELTDWFLKRSEYIQRVIWGPLMKY